MNKAIYRILCFVLAISIITVSCFAVTVDIGDPEYFSSLEFPHIETASSHNVTGYIEAVDAREFLSWIVLYEQLNLEFTDFTTKPYAIQDVTFDLGGSYADAMVASMIIGRINVAQGLNSGWVMLNGRPYDKSNGYIMWSADDGPAPWYVSVSNVDPPGSAGPYTYGLTANQNHNVIVYQAGQNDPLIEIRDKLNTISVNMANMLSNNTDSIKNLLSTIYQSCNNIEYSLTDISNYLSSISISCSNIASKANQIYAQDTATQTIIDGISDYLETELPVLENDLYSIASALATFSYNFSNYASQVLTLLSSIDANIEHMDGTLDEMMEHFNGTALQEIPVEGHSGSGITNLWQLIKGAVWHSISGVVNLYNLLFEATSNWAYNASLGFDYLSNISDYEPIPYNPGGSQNVLVSFANRTFSNSNALIVIEYPEIRITCPGTSSNTSANFCINSAINSRTIHLDAGRYRMNGVGNSGNIEKYVIVDGVGNKTIRQSPLEFTYSSAVTIAIFVYFKPNIEFHEIIYPTIVRIG